MVATAPTTDSAAYVIVAHRWPEQVTRLMRAIRRTSPDSGILVHHDVRASAAPDPLDERTVVNGHRTDADWGSWELVNGSLEALRIAQRTFDPTMVTLVSGQDYPTVNLATWEREFLASGGGWQGTASPLRYTPRWGRPYGEGDDDLTRYTYRWYPLPRALNGAGAAHRLLRSALFKVGHHAEPALDVRILERGRGLYVGVRRRRLPFGPERPCVKGSQWFTADRELLRSLLDTHEQDRLLRETYQHSVIPDESYPQTILNAVRPPRPAPPVSFNEWIPADDTPKVLTLADLPTIEASGSPFCRKVEPGVSDDLMAALDRRAVVAGGPGA